jgi:hypothetical protein
MIRILAHRKKYRGRGRSQSSLTGLRRGGELTQHRFSTIELRDSLARSGAEPVLVAVGMRIAPHPPHGSGLEELPHPALALGSDASEG